MEDDGELFEEKMERLTALLADRLTQASRQDELILKNLASLGYPVG